MRIALALVAISCAAVLFAPIVVADTIMFQGSGATAGLSATAVFTLDDGGSTLVIELTNTSTSVPTGFTNADQLLTALAFNLPTGFSVTGDSVKVGSGSTAYFSSGTYASGYDVSGEWAYANPPSAGALKAYDIVVTAMEKYGGTAFGSTNLDSTSNLDGPQGGLTNGLVALAGTGAIQNSVVIRLNLSSTLTDSALTSMLLEGAALEWGSDAAYTYYVPEPGTVMLVASALVTFGVVRRRRRVA